MQKPAFIAALLSQVHRQLPLYVTPLLCILVNSRDTRVCKYNQFVATLRLRSFNLITRFLSSSSVSQLVDPRLRVLDKRLYYSIVPTVKNEILVHE